MKTGLEHIIDERNRQLNEKGYTIEHDSQHDATEFIRAAKAYIDYNFAETDISVIDTWPWLADEFKPKDIITNLKKAGALIAAAIDRLQIQE